MICRSKRCIDNADDGGVEAERLVTQHLLGPLPSSEKERFPEIVADKVDGQTSDPWVQTHIQGFTSKRASL